MIAILSLCLMYLLLLSDYDPAYLSFHGEQNNQSYILSQNNNKSCLSYEIESNGNVSGINVNYSISLKHDYSFVKFAIQRAEILLKEGNCKLKQQLARSRNERDFYTIKILLQFI